MKPDELINRLSGIVDEQLAESDPIDLSPYCIGALLSDASDVINLARNDTGNKLDSSFSDRNRKLKFLWRLLKELGDNFFPMAHTTERLEKLRIITIDELRVLIIAVNKLQEISWRCSAYIDEITRVSNLNITEEIMYHRQFFEREPTLIYEVLGSLDSARQQVEGILEAHRLR